MELEAVEKRLEQRIEQCVSDVDNKIYKSHNAIAAITSHNGKQIGEMSDKLEQMASWFRDHDTKEQEYQRKVDTHLSLKQLSQDQLEKLVEMVQDYTERKVLEKSVKKIKDFATGFVAFCAAIGVVIGGVISFIRWVK